LVAQTEWHTTLNYYFCDNGYIFFTITLVVLSNCVFAVQRNVSVLQLPPYSWLSVECFAAEVLYVRKHCQCQLRFITSA